MIKLFGLYGALLCLVFASYGCKKQIVEKALPAGKIIAGTQDTVNSIPDINLETVTDNRLASLGNSIYSAPFIDIPFVVQPADSSWVCVFTAGPGEGKAGERVLSTRSTDLGKTWSQPVEIEPATGPVTSSGLPYITKYGRLYVFYAYNGDNVSVLKGVSIKNDMLGWYCYKYSDDMGKTWSARYRIPIRVTTADLTNDWGGTVQLFCGIDKPKLTSKGMIFTFSKFGKYLDGLGEGWMLNCPNIETEKNAANLTWKCLPDGNLGFKHPQWYLQEEHNVVQLSTGDLYCVNRTQQGFPAFCTSKDFGSSWTTPTAMRYGLGDSTDRVIKTPVAYPRIFKLKNGNYLLWYHNNGMQDWANRNPAWVSGGVEVNGKIRWSEPEILIYSNNSAEGFSYPDLIEQGGKYYITETQKQIARVHEVNASLLNGLWYQFKRKTKVTNGLAAEFATKADAANYTNSNLLPLLASKGGFTFDFQVKFNTLGSVSNIFSNIDAKNNGIKIYTTANKTVAISLTDGNSTLVWETDQALLTTTKKHQIAFTVDGACNILTAMVDGKLCDGGTAKKFGWTKFTGLSNLNTNSAVSLASNLDGTVSSFKVYSRALRTSELISNYNFAK